MSMILLQNSETVENEMRLEEGRFLLLLVDLLVPFPIPKEKLSFSIPTGHEPPIGT